MKLSIIIPTLNEEKRIGNTITKIWDRSSRDVYEIIVVDGGSEDQTVKKVRSLNARIFEYPEKNRAAQMNLGARHCRGDTLLFLHADSHPPKAFARSIKKSLANGIDAGCFQLGFDRKNIFLDFYAWCTKFDFNAFRFGDQGLFIKKKIFNNLRGYRENHLLLEDNEMVRRIRQKYSFDIMNHAVTTSARKYEQTGPLKLQLWFILIYLLYQLGLSQKNLMNIYRRLL